MIFQQTGGDQLVYYDYKKKYDESGKLFKGLF